MCYFLVAIAIGNQLVITAVTHFMTCDVTNREGKILTNDLILQPWGDHIDRCQSRPVNQWNQAASHLFGVIALDNQRVINHSLFGRGSFSIALIWSWEVS